MNSKEIEELENLLYKKTVKSEFLEELYSSKPSLRDQFNLKDIEGRRLSAYWKNGDTILSVSWKKALDLMTRVLDPDTYSKETYKAIKKQARQEDVYIYMYLGLMMIPLMVYIPFILPRLKKVKRDYLFHQYVKKKFFEDELQVNRRHIKLRDMKKILKNANEEEF